MAGIGDLFGKGTIGEQLFVWGFLSQVVQTLTEPGLNELAYLVNAAAQNVNQSPDVLANLVNQGLMDEGPAATEAAESGLNHGRFDQLVKLAAGVPDLGAVLEAYRRKMIPAGNPGTPDVSLFGALTKSGISDDWQATVEQLATTIPTIAEVMNAWLEGQIEEAEALERYTQAGGDPTWFQTSYNANGQAPTPTQLLEMLNRGFIGESGTGPASTSYEQGFLEGPWRNKWEKPMLALKAYLPPPRTVTALVNEGAITHDVAAQLLVWQGLSAELAAAYLSGTTHAKAATEKHLAKTDLFTLASAGLISPADLTSGLTALGYTAHDAALLVKLADLKAKTTQLSSGVSRVRALYEAGKLTAANAKANLATLQVPADQVANVIAIWDVDLAKQVKTLTSAQVLDLWEYDIEPTANVISRLGTLGYDQADAADLIAIKNKGKLTAAQTAGGASSVAT